jgi:hypothetical protein
MGAHQKIDRVAKRHLNKLIEDRTNFPTIKQIINFEGKNGPDAIKRKSPAKDEPWHYLNPLDDHDHELFELIDHHYAYLVRALKKDDKEHAAFEAAWLAHAIVDGLTPAHHFPYEEKLVELRKGEGLETRTTIKEKWVMKGDTRSERIANNWRAWGPRGLFIGHVLFELGFSAIIKPLTMSDARPLKRDIKEMSEVGISEYFQRRSREVVMMELFEYYLKYGWNARLAVRIRNELAPLMVKTVCLAWYQAFQDSQS